jgi:hypothetical protein
MVVGTQHHLGQPGKLEEAHIGAAQRLQRMREHVDGQARGMRRVEDRQAVDALGRARGQVPCHHAAPVVANDREALMAETTAEFAHVVGQRVERIGMHPCRLGRRRGRAGRAR